MIDYALHDLVGKALNTPVYNLLGGSSNEKIPLCFVMSSDTPEVVAADGAKLIKAGFRSLKLKVGSAQPRGGCRAGGCSRKAVGSNVKIMLDANGGWHYNQALNTLKRMEKYDIFLCEQPVPRWDFQGLARLRRKVNIPIFADESACELNDLLKLIQMDAIDGFFLKVPKAGGSEISEMGQHRRGCRSHGHVRLHDQLRPRRCLEAHFLAATEWMRLIEQESSVRSISTIGWIP